MRKAEASFSLDKEPRPMRFADQLPKFFDTDTLKTELSREDGIPLATFWRPTPVMTLEDAVRIAARLQYLMDCPVHFQELTATSVSFFVYDDSKAYTASQRADYGMSVQAWLPAVLELHPPTAQSTADVQDDLQGPATLGRGLGFNWTRRADFYSTARSGKWCVTRMGADVDSLWEQVRMAVHEGHIPAALVSTPKQAAGHGGSYVICVFTPDWTDFEGVKKVRELLRTFGVTEEVGYKRDIDTERNVYGGPREWIYRD